ncbi:casein kinase II subunit alpha'-interacting protein isoform X4 [Monodelphis domestica]|uniref:casein kinase II subunit alpha'-interacting protein isoform X4 n=1 Tax=Monodelphis domestica TaxID=13616 RepID=UPI0007B40B2D|nr:casein kinase II subunit alpha'-interacting protein isoform X4 [Monodelphis domestica]
MRETCIHDSHFLLDLQKLLLLGIIEVTCFLLFLKLLLVLFPEENNSRRLKRRRWRKLPDVMNSPYFHRPDRSQAVLKKSYIPSYSHSTFSRTLCC